MNCIWPVKGTALVSNWTREVALVTIQPLCCANGTFVSGWFKHYFHILLRCAVKIHVSERLGRQTHCTTVTQSEAVLSVHSTQRDAQYTQVMCEDKSL